MMWFLWTSPLTAALSLLALFTGVLYWFCTNTFDYWKKKGVPYEPPVPFFGNIKDIILMRKNFNLRHQELYNRFEGHRFAGIFHARKPAFFIRDPELIKSVLVRDFSHFHDRGILVHADKYPLQQHLFNLPGYKWRVLRNKLSPTFTSGRIKTMFPILEECSGKLVKSLKNVADENKIVELKEFMAQFATDIIGTCAFGLQMNAMDNPDSDFRRMGRKVFMPTMMSRFAQFTNFLMPELGRFLKMDELGGEEVTKFFMNVVKETTDFRLKNNFTRNDFLQLLINLKYKGNVDASNEKEVKQNGINGMDGKTKETLDFNFDLGLMSAQAFVFFLAGFETSSSTMGFAAYELAKNPDIQQKLREEIDASLAETGGKFTYDSIMNMKYLDKVISEALRMYPSVMFLIRQATEKYHVPDTDNLVLDRGTSVIIPVYALHWDPQYYPDPDRFDPERFSAEEKANRNPYAYLPFGEGPRNCIGMRFGLLQTKLGVAALVANYEVHVCEETEIPIRYNPKSMVTASTTGIILRVTHRS